VSTCGRPAAPRLADPALCPLACTCQDRTGRLQDQPACLPPGHLGRR